MLVWCVIVIYIGMWASPVRRWVTSLLGPLVIVYIMWAKSHLWTFTFGTLKQNPGGVDLHIKLNAFPKDLLM